MRWINVDMVFKIINSGLFENEQESYFLPFTVFFKKIGPFILKVKLNSG